MFGNVLSPSKKVQEQKFMESYPTNNVPWQFWKTLEELKHNVKYLELLSTRDETRNMWLNMILAITSCSSIAAWAIWQQYSIVWAIIIAAGQVITAIKPYLPFRKRFKAFFKILPEIYELFFETEKKRKEKSMP